MNCALNTIRFTIISVFCNAFPKQTKELFQKNPTFFCSLFGTRPFTIHFHSTFFILAILKIFIAFFPNIFMNFNHETLGIYLPSLCLGLTLVDFLSAIIVSQSYCGETMINIVMKHFYQIPIETKVAYTVYIFNPLFRFLLVISVIAELTTQAQKIGRKLKRMLEYVRPSSTIFVIEQISDGRNDIEANIEHDLVPASVPLNVSYLIAASQLFSVIMFKYIQRLHENDDVFNYILRLFIYINRTILFVLPLYGLNQVKVGTNHQVEAS